MSTAIVPADADLSPSPTVFQSIERAQAAFESLSQIISPFPLSSPSEDPALDLLRDPRVAHAVSRRLRQPSSGAGDDNLCRWLYDTFQSTDPSLQLAVLRFLPSVAGLYLSRCTGHRHYQPLAGFEAVLLALYAHQTLARNGEPLAIRLPNLSAPNPYHDPATPTSKKSASANKNAAEDPVAATAVLSHKLEPHGTMRSTRRARVVGVALELYFSRLASIPNQSKLEFCHFASAWAGRSAPAKEPPKPEEPEESKTEEPGEEEESSSKPEDAKEEACSQDESEKFVECAEEEEAGEKGERIPLPWELIQPTLRILGHCLLAPSADEELKAAAEEAVKGMHERAMHDMNTQAVLATRSLVRLGAMPEKAYEPPAPNTATEFSNSETAIVAV